MIKIVLAIRALDIGGAERQFIELVKHIDKERFDVTVCTMYGGEQEEIAKNIPDITYVNLQKRGRYDFYKFYKNYKKLLKETDPDVIYSYLGEMNLFSLWCKPKKTKMIWGFRSSGKDWSKYGKADQIIFWLQKKLSTKIDKIIANSYASISYHKEHGYDMNKAVVVHNGINSHRFQRDSREREYFRKKYALAKDDIAIGMVARINPIKGYDIFAKAAKKILDEYDNISFFSVGGGSESIKKECESILGEYNGKRFFWIGNQINIEDSYSGLDIVVSSSFAEGFSNSIAEAMSCSLAPVVTDVGDSKMMIADTGIAIEPNDVENLYGGIKNMIDSDYMRFGEKARERIVEEFSIDTMVKKTENEIVQCVG